MRTLRFTALLALLAFPSHAVHSSVERVRLPGREDIRRSASFIDDTLAGIRSFITTTTSFTARVSLTRHAAGVRNPVRADATALYRAPDSLTLSVTGRYPFTTVVSNSRVITSFPLTGTRDVRPLMPGESLWADILGISGFPDEDDYLFRFSVQDTTYTLHATLRQNVRMDLLRDPVAHAWRAVDRTIRVDLRSRTITETRTLTLAGEETHMVFTSLDYDTVTHSDDDDAN